MGSPTTHTVVARIKTVDLGKEVESVELRNVTDVHAGSPDFDRQQFESDLAWALQAPNRYIVLGGDLFENATRSSVGDVFDMEMNVREVRLYLLEKLKPLSSAGKILGAVGGNHEHRSKKESGDDLTESLALLLGIDYFEDEAFFNIRFGRNKVDRKKISYVVYLHHGSGGGSTPGGKANAATKFAKVSHADVFLSGHTHGQLAYKDGILMPNPQRGTVSIIERLFVACGTYHRRGSKGYGVRAGYGPVVIGSPIVTLSGTEKKASVTL